VAKVAVPLYFRFMHESPIDVHNFDAIRPYNDVELKEAIERILDEPGLYKMLKWVYPGLSKTAIQQMMRSVQTIEEFQSEISGPTFKTVIQTTTSGLTFTNMDSLDKSKAYLYLSNHRDIILDSALLNVSLLEKGYPTTQIAIGDNLLQKKVVEDIVRSNKNFIVNRNVSTKDVYFYSLRLSNYIHRTIFNDNCSIWIAQREGRSKDGDDRTATGLLKMFTMSNPGAIEDTLEQLNIVPMAVSYEYDPCDVLKTNELMHQRILGHYEKKPFEDFHSMITGITGHKGRVNISVGDRMNEAIDRMRSIQNKNEKYKYLTQQIDLEMHRIYKLWPTNYIAYDLLNGSKEYKEHYTNIQKIAFGNYIRSNVFKLSLNRRKTPLPREGFSKMAREIMLQMYANPVTNKKKNEVTSEWAQSL
jgi:hypothetical protein